MTNFSYNFAGSGAIRADSIDVTGTVTTLGGCGNSTPKIRDSEAIRRLRAAGAIIIGEIRLPRTLLALVVGAALGLSGAALQGLLRNPLADPGILGVSSGAGAGAMAAILDSNITTFLVGLVLFNIGSGPVRGFAVVHCLGILTSIFSSVVVSRALVNLIYGRQKKLTKVAIGQIWKPGNSAGSAAVNGQK